MVRRIHACACAQPQRNELRFCFKPTAAQTVLLAPRCGRGAGRFCLPSIPRAMRYMLLAPCAGRSAGCLACSPVKTECKVFVPVPQPKSGARHCAGAPQAHRSARALSTAQSKPSGSARRFAGGSTRSQCTACLLAPCPATAQAIDACAVAQPRCNDLRWRLTPTTIQTTSFAPQCSRSARRCCAFLTPAAAQCRVSAPQPSQGERRFACASTPHDVSCCAC